MPGKKTITDKKGKKRAVTIHTCSKKNLLENMHSYIEYRISFTTLCLQKLVKNC